jgi:hypothetical protein
VLYELSHLTSFAGSYLAVSQICEVAQRIKVHNPEPWMDRNNKIVPKLEKDFEPYSIMFNGVDGE